MTGAMVGSFAVPVAFATTWLIERRRPARAFVPVAGWARRGVLFFVVTAVVGSLIPACWNATGLAEHPVLHLGEWGLWGAPLGLLAVTLVHYAVHRAEHHFDWLWLATHQLHHSALRVDVAGAFFAHPAEVALKGSLGFLVSSALLGLSVEAAAIVGMGTALLSIFQHWNIRTPWALGFFLPRPEMHALHHEYGAHRRNYGDLPIWDLVFGTWENPEAAEVRVGFTDAASARVGDMLLMRDVNRGAQSAKRKGSIR